MEREGHDNNVVVPIMRAVSERPQRAAFDEVNEKGHCDAPFEERIVRHLREKYNAVMSRMGEVHCELERLRALRRHPSNAEAIRTMASLEQQMEALSQWQERYQHLRKQRRDIAKQERLIGILEQYYPNDYVAAQEDLRCARAAYHDALHALWAMDCGIVEEIDKKNKHAQ